MAITFNTKTSAVSPWDPSPYSTASVTPTANALQLLAVAGGGNASYTPFPIPTSVTGCGLTWVLVNSVSYKTESAPSPKASVAVYRAMGASPTTGPLTITYSGNKPDVITWSLVEFAGVDTSGTNGSGAVRQSVSGFDNTPWPVSGLSLTLAALGSANNATYGAFQSDWDAGGTSGPVTLTAGSGYSMLHTNGADMVWSGTEWKAAGSTTVNITGSPTSGMYGGVAVEIKALSTDVQIAITGVSGTASRGSVTSKHKAALSGAEAVSALGDVQVPVVHGVEGVGQVGNLSVRIATSLQVTGVETSTEVGSVGVTRHADVTQVMATADEGSPVVHRSAEAQLTGVGATGGLGSLGLRILHDIMEPPPPPPRPNNNETSRKLLKRPAPVDYALNWVLRTIGGSDNPLNAAVRAYYPTIDEDVLSNTVTNIMTEMNTFLIMKRGELTKNLVVQKEKQLVKYYALKAIQEHNADVVLDEDTTYKPGLLS